MCRVFGSVYRIDNIFQLSWKKHIKYVSTKLRTASFLIYKSSHILDCKSLKVSYLSLLYPRVDYCCEVWGNAHKSNIQCLFLLQKNVKRTITQSDYLANTNVLFYHLNILNLNDIMYKSYILFIQIPSRDVTYYIGLIL